MKWISVKDRLPKIKEYVLTYEKTALMPIKSNCIRNYENEFSYGDSKNITHWMPLPSHPKDK